jgi:hypothetical protein
MNIVTPYCKLRYLREYPDRVEEEGRYPGSPRRPHGLGSALPPSALIEIANEVSPDLDG